jgi:trimeric autotransporter adhesin
VSNGSGTVGAANVTNVNVTCTTNSFTVGGTVSGLVGSGLELRNRTENLPIAADGPFTFTTPVLSGATYGVTVRSQPTSPSQLCTVSGGDNGLGGGTIGASNVTSVVVTCLP